MLQHIESAILVILALTMGGYSPWVSATREATDLADANRGAGSAAIAVAPVPPQTPVAALGAKPSPQNTPARESSMVAPAASKTAPASTAGAGQSSVEPEPAPLPAPVAEVWAEVIPTSLEYSPELIEYFTEIGLNGEYGSASPGLRHWTEDIRIQVHGTPSGADIRTLHQVVEGLNRLVTGVELQIVGGNGNVDLHFAPEGRFADQEPAYVPVNLGFFRVWWDRGGAIYRARILIASQGITQQERDHLIREELTQSLGLFNDSWRYPDSIFYQGWTDTTRYTDLDEVAIRLLYHPSLRPGMSKGEVVDTLDALAGAACCAD